MRTPPAPMTRRAWLRGLSALAAGAAGLVAGEPARAHGELGPVAPPQPLPALALTLTLTLHDGRRMALAHLLQGRVTALQLMFTGCSSVCPLQGALFAQAQAQLPSAATTLPWQLLSVSIDPLGDDARALAAWRQRHGAGARWLAGVPALAEADLLLDRLRGRSSRGPDRHTSQVFVIDAAGRLAFRTAELADPAAIVTALRGVAGVSRRSA